MFIHTRFAFIRFLAVALVALLALTGCGGGGGGGGGSEPDPVVNVPPPVQKASVAILLTDAPSDVFDQILVSLSSIELLGDDEPVVLFSGDETIDLLALEKYADLFAINDDVPAGTYDKIRLRLTDLELVRLDDDGNVEESIHPRLPANGKIDLNPRGSFELAGGDEMVVQLDMDARRSIHIVGNGAGRYRFRPVVLVDVLTDAVDGKTARVAGDITEIFPGTTQFELCQSRPSSSTMNDDDDGPPLCTRVNVDNETGLFDADANSIAFADLAVGDTVTALGQFVVVDGDGFQFDARVVARGGVGVFESLEGVVLSSPDANDRFAFEIASGQGFATDTVIDVALQPGTGLVDEDGISVGADVIEMGVEAEVEGVVVLHSDSADIIRAIFVTLELMDDGVMPDDDEISVIGQFLTGDPATDSLTMATDDGDRCVVLDEDSRLFLIGADDDGADTDAIELAQIPQDAEIHVYGDQTTDGCVAANVILVFGT